MTTGWGSGSIRERRPGVWEIRVAAGTNPVTGRTLQRSVTFRGSERDANVYRRELAAEYVARRSVATAAPMLTIAELLERWLHADQPWKPSTRVGYRSNARFLGAEPTLGQSRVVSLTPRDVRRAFARWEGDGASVSVIGGRFRVLRAAVGWAYDERIIDHHPIRNMRGPGRTEPRRPLDDSAVRSLLQTAEQRLLEAVANDTGTPAASWRRHRAEQDLLLVRLAADTGARRGELAALRFTDLDGRTLEIRRSVSGDTISTPKSGRPRTLTIGSGTARLWHTLATDARHRVAPGPLGPWVFTSDAAHHQRLTVGALGHRFARLRDAAHVPAASLHRLRHSVATFLVARGEILQAQARLGHADAATTLREYAYALPRTDGDIADAIDRHLDRPAEDREVEFGRDPT
jgi:integrase